MTSGTRIPRTIEEFNRYLRMTCAYLMAGSPELNGLRLGFTQKEIDGWLAFEPIWAPLYEKYCDKKNGRTSGVIEQLHLTIDDAVEYNLEIKMLDRIAASIYATAIDLETFNIKKGMLQKSTRSVSKTPISESVQPILDTIGGGSVYIKCYTLTSARASIFEDADTVQFLWMVGDKPPTSVLDNNLTKDVSTRAAFTLKLGAENKAKYLYIYFRWYNTRYPELAGPWSDLETALIQ